VRICIIAAVAVMLALLCAHKTFGGWQFGARYTVDAIPLALLYLSLGGGWRLKGWELVTLAFGVMFNAYGALMMTYAFM